ncbi:uncharacterized protein [Blastocystis hominis]|uniref:Uncharacterized protein n=1 Tax=Blastocystis hominis TaxID=12968 RepID=D8MAF4_BLAHO|nr:uncharacterized protein [Blastocystis hominis]CBK25043.2 unnamed protein product [Blastocystis hominis]|eukprot:XP_012899091.1 uncharacterized protein [Blastocystis hominis]
MNQPIVPEHEIVNNALEINNYLISATIENQNLARFSDAVDHLETLSKNLGYLDKIGERDVEASSIPKHANL